MGHKTLTISQEAYNALASMKKERESFTEVILRLTKKAEAGDLLQFFRALEANEDLAAILEEVVRNRDKVTLRTPEV